VEIPETRYARSGDIHIAYQVIGSGPFDLTFVDQWFSNVDAQWRLPAFARFLERLAEFSRVIVLDKRGTGLSDPVPLGGLPTLEEWMDDVRAVLDDVGSERTALLTGAGSTYLALLFAATYPDRTAGLAIVDGYARLTSADDYLPGRPAKVPDGHVEGVRAGWGKGILLQSLAPEQAKDPILLKGFAEFERQSTSPGMAAAMIRMLYEADLRHVLPAIRVPTLVITHRDSALVPADAGRYLATHIPGARSVELPGSENLMSVGDTERIIEEVQEFFTGTRPIREPDRVLATILFTDIVGSTQRAAAIGDRAWRDVLNSHHAIVRRELERFRGREIDTAGDGFLAVFDGPARAVRCARAIAEEVSGIGIEIRAGLHTGEIEIIGDDIAGLAVHIGARVAAQAQGSEVLVSSTVKDLVVGSGLRFEDRGTHTLKGVPDPWHLFRALGETNSRDLIASTPRSN